MIETIRLFTDSDYDGIVDVHNAVLADYPLTVADMRYEDSHREARIHHERWVCETEGRIDGYAQFGQMSYLYHPRKFGGQVLVHPDRRGRGVGARLYERLLERLSAHDPLLLRVEIREDFAAAVRFAEARGFTAGMRDRESALDLGSFAPEGYAADLARVQAQSIAILGYDELAEDPDRRRKLYELDYLAARDMPLPEPYTQPAFETFCAQIFDHPKFMPDAAMVAIDEGAYIGISNLWRSNAPGTLHTGFTGVLREYRGRGLATALKVRVLAKAKAMGAATVLTWNDSTNAGMLGINQRLGFQARPAWINYERTFPAASGEDAERGGDRKD